jgi:hypothetical protein
MLDLLAYAMAQERMRAQFRDAPHTASPTPRPTNAPARPIRAWTANLLRGAANRLDGPRAVPSAER